MDVAILAMGLLISYTPSVKQQQAVLTGKGQRFCDYQIEVLELDTGQLQV